MDEKSRFFQKDCLYFYSLELLPISARTKLMRENKRRQLGQKEICVFEFKECI